MYKPKYFTLQELVPPAVYNSLGATAFGLLDDRLLIELDRLREAFGPIILNTWSLPSAQAKYGFRTESVFRVGDTKTGASFSQHKFGRAADCLFATKTAQEVRKAVLASPKDFPFIRALESNVSWFHFDVRNCDPIKVFSA